METQAYIHASRITNRSVTRNSNHVVHSRVPYHCAITYFCSYLSAV